MTTPELKKILLVEDEPDIQIVARLALESVGGFTVEVCSSGMEVIEKAAGLKVDLILLDVLMPEMDGPTTLRELRKNPELTRIPVIFLTAKVQAHEVEQYRRLGALDVIAKPFDPMFLSKSVTDIWDRSSGR